MTPADRPATAGRSAGADDDESVWPRGLGAGLLIVALAALLAVVYVLGSRVPDKDLFVTTDALGPESGESAAQYRDRAAQTLAEDGDGADDAERWALVTLAAPSTAEQAAAAADPARISQVVFDPVVDDAPPGAVPMVTMAIPAPSPAASAAELVDLAGVAAAEKVRVDDTVAGSVEVRARTAEVLAGDCDCVTALLVRAAPGVLRELDTRAQVTAVEALPGDAVYGRFAVRPAPVTAD